MPTNTASLPTHQELALGEIKIAVPLPKSVSVYRLLAPVPKPLPMGAASAIASQLKVARRDVQYVLELQRLFEQQPELKAKYEPDILSGIISPCRIIKRLHRSTT